VLEQFWRGWESRTGYGCVFGVSAEQSAVDADAHGGVVG
jgi:hypothetical protein